MAFPQGSIAPQARAESDPRHGGRVGQPLSFRGSFSTRKGGSLATPLPMTPNCEISGANSQGRQRKSRSRCWHKQWQKGASA